MKTPAQKAFLESTGKIVHHLNTIVVGLSGIESGICTKPKSLDISWKPTEPRTSSRSARAYILRATIVFLAEEFIEYFNLVLKLPVCADSKLQENIQEAGSKAERFKHLANYLSLTAPDLRLGPLLVLHWRNRIVHLSSSAEFTKFEQKDFLDAASLLSSKYKNLDPTRTLEDFHRGTPSLKDVSSLVAMCINSVKTLDAAIPEPSSKAEIIAWLEALGLTERFDRAQKMAGSSAKPARSISNFFVTHCPSLESSYRQHWHNDD